MNNLQASSLKLLRRSIPRKTLKPNRSAVCFPGSSTTLLPPPHLSTAHAAMAMKVMKAKAMKKVMKVMKVGQKEIPAI